MNIIKEMERHSLVEFGKKLQDANKREKYTVLSKSLMEDIIPNWIDSEKSFKDEKRAYYFSSEFLMGRALSNNLINMNLKDEVEEVLRNIEMNYNDLEEQEEDAALGNGGLGRLAACFLDSAATLNLPLTGYGIRYEYGLFKQDFVDGFQVEEGDDWLKDGDPWSIRKKSEIVKVDFRNQSVLAVPYDTPIIGYGARTINTLRLWKSEAVDKFDFEQFDLGEYDLAVKEKNNAENITKVLYPNDTSTEGKKLRLKQQYFFVSASLQDLVKKHKEKHKSLLNFDKFHTIQLNDTHPAVAIPEMMRILVEVENLNWDLAWDIVNKVFAYTNHTLLAEALEQWDVELYRDLLPTIYRTIRKIDIQLIKELRDKGLKGRAIRKFKIVKNKRIKMAWLSIYGSKSINGVAELHTDLLKHQELKHWYKIYPEKFNNKTNGITQRRWLLKSNPELSSYITELLDSKDWITDLDQLKKLEKYKDDIVVLNRFQDIKQIKKNQLADYIFEKEGINIDSDSIFDIQIKRFHEYKRQLLNAFHILDLYFRLKEDKALDIIPRTFIFGGKAAPGYFRAKAIIKYINDIKQLVNNDKDVSGKIKVVFIKNYNVSYGEKLFPAADISEQISTAGKEASGTGNMKFMLNGTPTIGTYDGANVEIVEEVGIENNFIFGLRVEDIEKINKRYNPELEYKKVKGLKRVVDTLIDGTFDDEGTGMYKELYESLLKGADWHEPDAYYLIKDFDGYRKAQQDVNDKFKDKQSWARMCWMNLANAGKFSSDRTIKDYATDIWDVSSNIKFRTNK